MPIVHIIICDDIRTEVGGKKTFVGVYPGRGIIVESFPFRYPILAFFFEIEDATIIEKLEFVITPPKGEPLLMAIDIERPVPKIYVEARFENIVIPEPGNIHIQLLGIKKEALAPSWKYETDIPVKALPKPTKT